MWNRPYDSERKSGDDGMTYLDTGQRVPKTHSRIIVCGDLEELMCHIGLLMYNTTDPRLVEALSRIQSTLDNIRMEFMRPHKVVITARDIEVVDSWIEGTGYEPGESICPILPNGGQDMIRFMLTGTVCRRAERNMWRARNFSQDESAYNEYSFAYINRLGDLLFALAAS